jgi:DNA-binding CsgD family transcriptional regulator
MGGVGPDPVILIERAAELATLDDAAAAVCAGSPVVVTIEGPAGIGKSALLLAARQAAASRGLRVLSARGGELEQGMSLGIARQLFERLLLHAPQQERTEMLTGTGASVARLLGLDQGAVPGSPADEFVMLNALYRLSVRLAERSPVMFAIDDLHWADVASLRWLAYLIRRLEDLPVLLVLAKRSDEDGPGADLLARIAAEPAVVHIRPKPLSVRGVGELAAEVFGAPPQDRFAVASHSAAGGNPLFALTLLEAARGEGLRPVDHDADAVSGLAPARLAEFAMNKLRRLTPAAVTVAESVALLGSETQVHRVAALSGLSDQQVLQAGDECAAAGLLRDWHPFEFVHPVIGSGVYASIPAGRRAAGHRQASRLLASDGADTRHVAAHLLKAPPAADQWAVQALHRAAAAEVRPEARIDYLRRALSESPKADAVVLLALGQAESLVYDAAAISHLGQALREGGDPGLRAIAAGQLASCLVEHGRADEAVPILREAIAGLPESDPVASPHRRQALLILHGALLEADLYSRGMTRERLAEPLAMAGDARSAAERELLGMVAMVAPAAGATSSEVAQLAARALERADLSTIEGLRLITCPVWALEFADRLDEADRWLLRIEEAAQHSGWPSQFLLAASARAAVCCRRGALADAEQEARAALELADAQSGGYGVTIATAALLMALTEQDRLAEAETLLAGAPVERGARCDASVYVFSRGWLRLAQGQSAAAAAEFREAGRLMRQAGHDFPGFWPWRVGAAAAELALGHGDEAAELAREHLDRTRAFGAPGPTGVALLTLGLAQREARLDLLAAACAELDRSPDLLDRAKAHLHHGAALRRAGYRTDARVPLRTALDLAGQCGAAALVRRAREELTAAGARPRRVRGYGPDALTASELRVTRRAADGLTNREIAQELFVTAKAVEKHLASAYRKLGINGRGELPAALALD